MKANTNSAINLLNLISQGNEILSMTEDNESIELIHIVKWVQYSKTFLHRVINDKYQLRLFQEIADKPQFSTAYEISQVLRMIGILESCRSVPLEYRRIENKYLLLREVLRNFNKFATESQRRSRDRDGQCNRFEDEYDIQDALHSVLKLFFSDIRREDYVPNSGGASSRIDFHLPEISTGIEVKYATNKLKDKDIGDQISADIQRYKGNIQLESIVFFIYDPDSKLRNPEGLKDLQGNKGVEIIINP